MIRPSLDDSAAIAEFALPDLAATHSLARRLAGLWRLGDVIALRGDLGVGKTELARAAIRSSIGAEIEVPSPTFTLVQIYQTQPAPVWHFDLYRLTDPEEAIELGWSEARTDGIALVEWPDRLGHLLPDDRLDVFLEDGADSDARTVRMTAGASWRDRLPELVG